MLSFTLLPNDMFKVNINVWVEIIKSKMTYSESELDSIFLIHSVSDFDSDSDSDSDFESDFSLAVMNLDICIFFILFIPRNKPADGFFLSILMTESIVTKAMQALHIYFWRIITEKVCFYHAVKFSYFSFQVSFIMNRFAMQFNAWFIFNHISNFFVFFPHFIILNKKRHAFPTFFKLFDVSTHLR